MFLCGFFYHFILLYILYRYSWFNYASIWTHLCQQHWLLGYFDVYGSKKVCVLAISKLPVKIQELTDWFCKTHYIIFLWYNQYQYKVVRNSEVQVIHMKPVSDRNTLGYSSWGTR